MRSVGTRGRTSLQALEVEVEHDGRAVERATRRLLLGQLGATRKERHVRRRASVKVLDGSRAT